jgi:c-di-GMP-binding flagellar brake protein YcgR
MIEDEDRRRSPRVKVKCNIVIKNNVEKSVIDAFTEDLSIGGMCVFLPARMKLFNEVDIRIFFDDNYVDCSGTVIWAVEKRSKGTGLIFDIGIEFIDMSQEAIISISREIEKITQKS